MRNEDDEWYRWFRRLYPFGYVVDLHDSVYGEGWKDQCDRTDGISLGS